MNNPRPTILIVDDETSMQTACSRALGNEDYKIRVAGSVGEARVELFRRDIDVALLDVRLPDGDGIDLVAEVQRTCPNTEIIVMTGHGGVTEAVAAVKAGAYDFLTKPIDPIEKLTNAVKRALERKSLRDRADGLAREADAKYGFDSIVGTSPVMAQALTLARDVAYSASSVLIRGESGTGKELIARAVHRASPRKDAPFVVVNCGALPENLIESELFGHTRGSFTGAIRDKRGLFEEANGGTIFLDEIGEMPPQAQVRLLRVLQEGEVRRIGASETKKVDVRILAATNADLAEGMKNGTFREDLYYRLNVITVELPPLRSRPDDIAMLSMHFMRGFGQKLNKEVRAFSDDALRALVSYNWPGNVRELENAIERSVVLSRSPQIGTECLPEYLFQRTVTTTPDGRTVTIETTLSYREAKERATKEFDRSYVSGLLSATNGNMAEAARIAGLDRSNFRKIVKRAGVDYRDFQASKKSASVEATTAVH